IPWTASATNDEDRKLVAEAVQGMWQRNLVIDLPLLIFQTDDNPEISLPHSLDRFGHQRRGPKVGGRSGPGNVAEKSRGCRRFGKSGVEGLSQEAAERPLSRISRRLGRRLSRPGQLHEALHLQQR